MSKLFDTHFTKITDILGPDLVVSGTASGSATDYDVEITSVRYPQSTLNILELLECTQTMEGVSCVDVLESVMHSELQGERNETHH